MNAVVIALLLSCASQESGAADQAQQFQYKAGLARTVITPQAPIRMSGYAARSKPSEGVLHELWAKALALEDLRGQKVVILTADLIALPAEVCQQLAAHLKDKHGLERSQLLCNASHTHSGPMVGRNLSVMGAGFDDAQRQAITKYTEQLQVKLAEVCDAALADLKPARLAVGAGKCTFAINRREPTDKGVRLGLNPKGPVDHTVPVLRVETPDGKLRAVLFAYACHNTTLGPDIYQLNGDYAGFAQLELEKKFPDATAMFMILCGGDQNPSPRGKVEHAQQHGQALAEEVARVLGGLSEGATALKLVKSHIATAFEVVKLDFPPYQRETYEKQLQDANRFRQQRAKLMLEAFDRGAPVRNVDCPVQAVRLGDEVVLVAIAGEVVIDYALRLKREYPQYNLVVAGYSNDVPCYIPSLRVLREGGYEPVDSMIYYGLPGPLAENVEELVIAGCRKVLRQVGIEPAQQQAAGN